MLHITGAVMQIICLCYTAESAYGAAGLSQLLLQQPALPWLPALPGCAVSHPRRGAAASQIASCTLHSLRWPARQSQGAGRL